MPRLNSPNTYIIEIQLRGATIPVWRIIEIPHNSSLHLLHLYIQIAMGWTCSHLYEFKIDDIFYQYIFLGENAENPTDKIVKDSTRYKLKDLNLKRGSEFTYEYDFGDNWVHDISIKAITVAQISMIDSPCCTTGEMACPPEDIGGIHVYNQLVQFRLVNTPISMNSDLEDYFQDFDIYKIVGLRSLTFESLAKRMHRNYKFR